MKGNKNFFDNYEDSLDYWMDADEMEFALPEKLLQRMSDMPKEKQDYVMAVYLGLHKDTFPHMAANFEHKVSPETTLFYAYRRGQELRNYNTIMHNAGHNVTKNMIEFEGGPEVHLLTNFGRGYFSKSQPEVARAYEQHLIEGSEAYVDYYRGMQLFAMYGDIPTDHTAGMEDQKAEKNKSTEQDALQKISRIRQKTHENEIQEEKGGPQIER